MDGEMDLPFVRSVPVQLSCESPVVTIYSVSLNSGNQNFITSHRKQLGSTRTEFRKVLGSWFSRKSHTPRASLEENRSSTSFFV